MPIVIGLIGDFHAAKEPINTVLGSLPKTIPHLAVADSAGLGHKGDKVHFDAAAYREFGKRYAAKWRELLTESK